MNELLNNAGPFLYPLAACSFLAVVIVVERLIALRKQNIIATDEELQMEEDRIPVTVKDSASIAGTIHSRISQIKLAKAENIRSGIQVEVSKLERGLFVLDVVVAVAPLIGLLGTVSGLIQVFGNFGPENGLPDTNILVEGIALALSTTVLGLSIAIPAVIGSSYLNRKVDHLATLLDHWGEYLIKHYSK